MIKETFEAQGHSLVHLRWLCQYDFSYSFDTGLRHFHDPVYNMSQLYTSQWSQGSKIGGGEWFMIGVDGETSALYKAR